MRKILAVSIALVLAASTASAAPKHRRTQPKPQPVTTHGLYMAAQAPAATAKVKPTVAQAQQNPLIVLQQFSVSDLQAALADAQAQTPPDQTAIQCYTALIPFVQSQVQNPLPSGVGVFQALQKARDAKAYIANIQSPTGPLAQLNLACAPLVLDVQNTLLTMGVTLGIVANPAGAAGAGAAALGIPAAVAAFLNLPKL